MKTTYLIRSTQADGSTVLVETSAEHWHEIVENNKLLPKNERRYFITDTINEFGVFDCMIMEVPYADYLPWHSGRSPEARNRVLRKTYQHVSIDAGSLENTVSISNMEDMVEGSVLVAELRNALQIWNTWAVFVLDMYLGNHHSDAIPFIMAQCSVSKSTAYRYIGQFKSFIKKFLSE